MRAAILFLALMLAGCVSLPASFQSDSLADQQAVSALANATNDSALSMCSSKLQAIAGISCALPDGTQGPACVAAKAYEVQQAAADSCAPLALKVRSSWTQMLSALGIVP